MNQVYVEISEQVWPAFYSDNQQQALLNVLSKIQNQPFYRNQDIMTFASFCNDAKELLSYVQSKLKGLK